MVYPLRGADGAFRSFLTRVEPIKDIQGRVVRWFGTNTDITDQRRIEEELRRINRELEEFAYVASHDLQEPLRMVNIYTQQILQNLAPGRREAERSIPSFVKQGVSRMEALIHDLLTFSRTVHSEEVPAGAADLSAAFEEALSVLKDRIEETGARIHGLSSAGGARRHGSNGSCVSKHPFERHEVSQRKMSRPRSMCRPNCSAAAGPFRYATTESGSSRNMPSEFLAFSSACTKTNIPALD